MSGGGEIQILVNDKIPLSAVKIIMDGKHGTYFVREGDAVALLRFIANKIESCEWSFPQEGAQHGREEENWYRSNFDPAQSRSRRRLPARHRPEETHRHQAADRQEVRQQAAEGQRGSAEPAEE